MTGPIISMWSGPRNVSTALMYSFGERADTCIVDEPLYGYYLKKTGVEHPGGIEVINDMELDERKVWSSIPRDSGKITFVKNMAHHALDLSLDWYREPVPMFLIRDPKEMLPSLTIQLPDASLRDTGLKRQVELLDMFRAMGKEPIVLDSKYLLLDPRKVLSAVCEKLGVGFSEKMLHWEPGPREADGIWAKHWYHSVHQSRGFQPYVPKTDPFPKELHPLLTECEPYYNQLLKHAIT